MTALKDHVDPRMVEGLAAEFAASDTDFPAAAFVERATEGLEELELMGRVRHVADALEHALPTEPAEVVAVFDAALASESFRGWMLWPCAEVIGRTGPTEPETVIPFMARLTPRVSCEFAIRPCIEQVPEITFGHLHQWVDHPDEHVRRLVSEGTRPRLPWGTRLRALQADPAPAIALLDRLRDDPSGFVRRSVANHLGDVVKDHPELALATAERWQREGGRHVDEVVRHGLRTRIKAGDAAALRLVGYDGDAPVRMPHLAISPRRLAIGETATLGVELSADGHRAVPVVVEYLVHYLGARGPRKPQAYRLAERTLQPGETCALQRRHTFAHASIRTLHPGRHLVEVQVNGRVLGADAVEITE
ncbi:DNA alkylation repair protein [Egibacter rhizosphaerae]|uniref:DNA alkylation repair protein n=1 Tax=Egibacter rhizosphaerae TaxID=1670831 RepID=A0A411YC30_9ACTN|nr:DNA alkylation repair protein [Egibacter rhizosphaerae]QBI18791.1 DNA alkylation repair protein [Egibacter rhizosphaerae]